MYYLPKERKLSKRWKNNNKLNPLFMKKLMLPLLLVFMLLSCKSHKVYFKDNHCSSLPKHSIESALKQYDAVSDNYSLLIFTSNFISDSLTVINNGATIYKGLINSDKSMGLAKAFRIENNFDVEISDIKSEDSFILKRENLEKHKYIYVEKNRFKKSKQYTVIYSNTLCGFK